MENVVAAKRNRKWVRLLFICVVLVIYYFFYQNANGEQ